MKQFEDLGDIKHHLTLSIKDEDLNISSCLTENSSPEIRLKERKHSSNQESKNGSEEASPDRSVKQLSLIAWESTSTEIEPVSYSQIVEEYYNDKLSNRNKEDRFEKNEWVQNAYTGLLYLKRLSSTLADVKSYWPRGTLDFEWLLYSKITEDEIFYLDWIEEFLNF